MLWSLKERHCHSSVPECVKILSHHHHLDDFTCACIFHLAGEVNHTLSKPVNDRLSLPCNASTWIIAVPHTMSDAQDYDFN